MMELCLIRSQTVMLTYLNSQQAFLTWQKPRRSSFQISKSHHPKSVGAKPEIPEYLPNLQPPASRKVTMSLRYRIHRGRTDPDEAPWTPYLRHLKRPQRTPPRREREGNLDSWKKSRRCRTLNPHR